MGAYSAFGHSEGMISTQSLLFGGAALAALAGIQAEWKEARTKRFFVLKPLATLLVVLAAAMGTASSFRMLVLVALALGLIGDVFLLFEGERAFLGGLGSFLIAHLAYVGAFIKMGAHQPPLWSGVFALYAVLFFAWLLPKTGAMKVPVLIYGVVLLAMGLSGAALFHTGSPRGPLVMTGVVLFLLSDSALAARLFGGPYPFAQPLVLATYYGAIGCFAAAV